MDRRQKKSRKAILGAFRKLLGQKSYAHITVKEIIDEADVGRSTFYAHFPTKDDLLFALSEEIFSHVFSHSLTKENTHDFRNSQNVSSYITHILYHVRENFPRELLKNESGEIFYRYFIIRFESIMKDMVDIGNEKINEEYVIHQLASSFIATIEWWLRGDRNESPEEVAQFFLLMNGKFIHYK